MTLRILTSAGVSPNSGVPIYRVQCSECGEVYRRVGFPWDIKRHGRCSTCAHAACAHAAKKVPNRIAGVNARRRARAAELRKCKP